MNIQEPPSAVLLIPRLRVQNANAISSPLTHGFPSITAFVGLMWALERKLGQQWSAYFNSVGVVCHAHEELVTDDYVKTFRLTRNPVSKDGSTAAIVEEGRIHLSVSLLFGIDGDIASSTTERQAEFAAAVAMALTQMRIAGGTVLPPIEHSWLLEPKLIPVNESSEEATQEFRRIRRQLLPGFCLVSRDDLLQQRAAALRQQDEAATLLDAWLDLSRINWTPPAQDGDSAAIEAEGKKPKAAKKEWTHDRERGWIVPIPVGYGALSPAQAAGTVSNARDERVPFQFVESLYSIGQWISPHRLRNWQQLMWYPHSDPDAGLYRARNDYAALI